MRIKDSETVLTPIEPGKFPELPSGGSAPSAETAPIELPRVVMRGVLAVAVLGVALALTLGMWRARADIREETDAALVLAQALARLAESAERPRATVLAALAALPLRSESRHLRLQVHDADGHALLSEPNPERLAPPLAGLTALSRSLFPPPPPQTVRWPLVVADGERWSVELTVAPDSEQHEALAQLLELLLLLLGGSALLIAVLYGNVRRSFRPLRPLLEAIASVGRGELAPLRALPPMPIRELDAIAAALRHLAGALEQAEASRRLLSRQVMTLQEDERHRLARDLHDELGQHLTALRVDAAWLAKRLIEAPDLAAVATGMGGQCERVQQALREVLTRLRPLDTHGADESLARLRALLDSLVAAWEQSPGQPTRYALDFDAGPLALGAPLPRELVLTVYRISQEALTNVARHARASRAVLRVHVIDAGEEGQVLDWCVEDDGGGLPDATVWGRGNGLAGVKERVWAAGGDLQCEPADAANGARPGLRLHARLPIAPSIDGEVTR